MKRLNEQGEEVDGVSVPVSIGPPRPCADNRGESSVVVDCVVSPNVLADCTADETGGHRDFICQLALHYVESKRSARAARGRRPRAGPPRAVFVAVRSRGTPRAISPRSGRAGGGAPGASVAREGRRRGAPRPRGAVAPTRPRARRYKLAMDRKYKLPRLKYKGDPEEGAQWVRDQSKDSKVAEASAGDARRPSGKRARGAPASPGPSERTTPRVPASRRGRGEDDGVPASPGPSERATGFRRRRGLQ